MHAQMGVTVALSGTPRKETHPDGLRVAAGLRVRVLVPCTGATSGAHKTFTCRHLIEQIPGLAIPRRMFSKVCLGLGTLQESWVCGGGDRTQG